MLSSVEHIVRMCIARVTSIFIFLLLVLFIFFLFMEAFRLFFATFDLSCIVCLLVEFERNFFLAACDAVLQALIHVKRIEFMT